MTDIQLKLRAFAPYAALLLCSACSLFSRGSSNVATDSAPATVTPPATAAPAAASGAGAGAGGAGRSASPFGIMSTIVPATMPLGGTPATAAPSTMPAAQVPIGTAPAAAAGGVAVAMPTAGVTATAPAIEGAAGASGMAAAPVAGQMAGSAFDPATFDEAHGRSRGTLPPGSPVEMGGLMCPNEVCKPLPALPAQASSAGVSVSLCCTPEGECGSKGGGPMSKGDPNECHIIPDSDPQCARLDLMGFEIASCCTADGKCGLNGEGFMMKPCGSIEEAMMMFGGFIELPPPAACLPGMGPPHSSSAPAPGSAPAAAGTSGSTTAPVAGAMAPAAAGSTASAPVAGSGAP